MWIDMIQKWKGMEAWNAWKVPPIHVISFFGSKCSRILSEKVRGFSWKECNHPSGCQSKPDDRKVEERYAKTCHMKRGMQLHPRKTRRKTFLGFEKMALASASEFTPVCPDYSHTFHPFPHPQRHSLLLSSIVRVSNSCFCRHRVSRNRQMKQGIGMAAFVSTCSLFSYWLTNKSTEMWSKFG